jgi:uncharacterized protein
VKDAGDLSELERELTSVLSREMPQSDSAHDLGHFRRVWANAKTIAEMEGAGDPEVLLAAAYLHDLVNLPKSHPDRSKASARSAEAAEPILIELGFDNDKITAIQHAIESHSFSAGVEPETVEARILQDADRLDAIGAIGIARMFAVSGSLDRPISHPDDPFAANRKLDDQSFALDHYPIKLLRLKYLMKTQAGGELAEIRTARMTRFLDDIADELGFEISEAFA